MLGFLIILLASISFGCQNVIVRILFREQTILGIFETGGFVTPNLQNSLLLVLLRMLLVVPMMALLVTKVYPPTWQDIRKLGNLEQPRMLLHSIGGGVLMFLFLVLLYMSIGLVPTGIAVTLFSAYPAFTALFSWRLFGNRPTFLRCGVIGLILLGSYLTISPNQTNIDNYSWFGIISAVASSVAYAFYAVNAQVSLKTLHPFPFTWISFTTTLILSVITLLIWHGNDMQLPWLPLFIGSLISALTTFVGNLMQNFGIRLIDATLASIVSASNPVLTTAIAWLVIQESLNSLQLLGMMIVILSVGLLSREHS